MRDAILVRPGDIFARNKDLYEHLGVAWFDGRVLYHSPRDGERLSGWEECAAGKPVRVPATVVSCSLTGRRFCRPRAATTCYVI